MVQVGLFQRNQSKPKRQREHLGKNKQSIDQSTASENKSKSTNPHLLEEVLLINYTLLNFVLARFLRNII